MLVSVTFYVGMREVRMLPCRAVWEKEISEEVDDGKFFVSSSSMF